MARWFFPFRESLQSPAIHQKDVEPSIAIVVIKGDSAAGSLKQVFVFLCSTEDGFRMQAGLASDVSKRHPGQRLFPPSPRAPVSNPGSSSPTPAGRSVRIQGSDQGSLRARNG